MTELQTKQLAFLEDTINHYTSNNRSIGGDKGNGCLYYPANSDSEGCAIGRHIQDKALCKKLDTMGGVNQKHVFDLLPDNLKELTIEFLDEIQVLHDNSANWCETGVSARGNINVDNIKKQFNLLE